MARWKDKISSAYFRLIVCKNVWCSRYLFKYELETIFMYSKSLFQGQNKICCSKLRMKLSHYEQQISNVTVTENWNEPFQPWNRLMQGFHAWNHTKLLKKCTFWSYIHYIGMNSLLLFLCLAQFHSYSYWQSARPCFLKKELNLVRQQLVVLGLEKTII